MSRVSPTKPPQVLVAKDILLAGSIRHLEAMIQVGSLYEKKHDAIYTLVDTLNSYTSLLSAVF